MGYLFIRIASKWYCWEMSHRDDLDEHIENIKDHLGNGNIVVLSDDKKRLVEIFGIDEADIIDVED